MPNHKSAKKRMKQDKKKRARNRAVKSELKMVVKRVTGTTDPEEGAKFLSVAASVVDKAAQKGVIHWRTAARKKSRLAKRVKSLSD